MYQTPYINQFEPNYNRFSCESLAAHKLLFNLKVYGEGNIKVKPDIAVVSLGVATENRDLSTAQQENAEKMRRVIDSLKAIGIPQKDIQTQAYTIEPQYDYIEGKQVFRGYRVMNIITVTIRDIDKVGTVVDTAVSNGANIVNNINFQVSDPSAYYKKALRLAIEDAQAKALAIESKLQVRLNPTPIKIVELGGIQGPSPMPMALKASEATTPIESGETTISARIEAEFNYL